jgi:hypothetical protein
MATQSYRQRLKAQRPKPGPSAKLCKELHRQAELRYEIRKLAMDGAVVGGAGQGQGRRAAVRNVPELRTLGDGPGRDADRDRKVLHRQSHDD